MHSGLTADRKFFVLVRDCNDVTPQFSLDKFVGSSKDISASLLLLLNYSRLKRTMLKQGETFYGASF